MLVLTIQEKQVVEKIKEGKYTVDFWKSEYAFLSTSFTSGYHRVRQALGKKLGRSLLPSESCYWGWVNSPFILFHKSKRNWRDLVALFVDIPEKDMVLSDYDKYTSYIQGEGGVDFIVGSVEQDDERCIQCSFMNLNPSNILLEVCLGSLLREGNEDISELYIRCMLIQKFLELKSGRSVP